MCETRDLGIKWPFWHTLIFEGDRSIDMRCVCPKDVNKMLLQQVRKVYWKMWAAKHEYEELKEVTWLEPALALMREKTKEDWNEKHRNVARKWVEKRLFDTCWSDESKCQACHEEEGTEKHRLYNCPGWYEIRREIPGRSRKPTENKNIQRESGSGKEVSSSTL